MTRLHTQNGREKRLPTEAEWEFAAQGALEGKRYAWGDELKVDGQYMANTWTGEFPYKNTAEDGFAGTAPVNSFPPNGYGLYDMGGNVWNWVSDFYRPDIHVKRLPRSGSRVEASLGRSDRGDARPPLLCKTSSFLRCRTRQISSGLFGAIESAF